MQKQEEEEPEQGWLHSKVGSRERNLTHGWEELPGLTASMSMEVDLAPEPIGNGTYLTSTELNAIQMLSGYDSEVS